MMNFRNILITINALDMISACYAANVQVVLPFYPNTLKHVFCDILHDIVDASSQLQKHLRNEGGE
jgi:hypothetical protein